MNTNVYVKLMAFMLAILLPTAVLAGKTPSPGLNNVTAPLSLQDVVGTSTRIYNSESISEELKGKSIEMPDGEVVKIKSARYQVEREHESSNGRSAEASGQGYTTHIYTWTYELDNGETLVVQRETSTSEGLSVGSSPNKVRRTEISYKGRTTSA